MSNCLKAIKYLSTDYGKANFPDFSSISLTPLWRHFFYFKWPSKARRQTWTLWLPQREWGAHFEVRRLILMWEYWVEGRRDGEMEFEYRKRWNVQKVVGSRYSCIRLFEMSVEVENYQSTMCKNVNITKNQKKWKKIFCLTSGCEFKVKLISNIRILQFS